LLLYDSAGGIARELWWANKELPLVDIIPPWFSMLIYHLQDEQFRDAVDAVQRRSSTPSTRSSSYFNNLRADK
jgi:hypothetical protein